LPFHLMICFDRIVTGKSSRAQASSIENADELYK
jgi:hypothetical protein